MYLPDALPHAYSVYPPPSACATRIGRTRLLQRASCAVAPRGHCVSHLRQTPRDASRATAFPPPALGGSDTPTPCTTRGKQAHMPCHLLVHSQVPRLGHGRPQRYARAVGTAARRPLLLLLRRLVMDAVVQPAGAGAALQFRHPPGHSTKRRGGLLVGVPGQLSDTKRAR